MANRVEQVDRTLFEYLRLGVVAAGFLPDVTAYGTAALYTAAKDTLRASLADKQLIEIFGVGASESRDEQSSSKIFINRTGFVKGGTGGFPATQYETIVTGSGPSAVTSFNKYMLPAASKNVRYEVRYITNSVKFDRIIMQLIEDIFGDRGYLKTVEVSGSTVTFTGQDILVDQENFVDVSSTDLIERVFYYIVPDVWIQNARVVTANIVPMSTVDVEMYYEGEDSSNFYIDTVAP